MSEYSNNGSTVRFPHTSQVAGHMDWALVSVILSVSTLGAAWFMRNRIKAYLGRAVLEGVQAWAWVESIEEGKVVQKPTPELIAMAASIAPSLIAEGFKAFQKRVPSAPLNVTGPAGELDMNAVLGLLPKRYQGYAALLLPLVQQYLPKVLGSSAPSAPAGGRSGGSGWQ